MSLLAITRLNTLEFDKEITAQFIDNRLLIKATKTNNINQEIEIPTLHLINYDTTLGKDVIVFTGRGTGKYNTKIHGGDLTLKS